MTRKGERPALLAAPNAFPNAFITVVDYDEEDDFHLCFQLKTEVPYVTINLSNVVNFSGKLWLTGD